MHKWVFTENSCWSCELFDGVVTHLFADKCMSDLDISIRTLC